MKSPKNIAITGASSGLGRALALHYAAPGITLYLAGRSEERLEQTAAECKAKGAAAAMAAFDITDAAAAERWLRDADAKTPIDLIIANAGISAGIGLPTPERSHSGFAQAGGGGESAEQTRAIFSINIGGVINTVQPLLPAMIARKRGQIAVIASLAGFRGLPSSPAYSASKACARVYAEGLRGWLAAYGIEINAVCPGFIQTPMTDVNPYPMPFMMSADKAAHIIAWGLAKNTSRIAFPRALYWPLLLATYLPPALTDRWFSRLPAKPSL